MSEVQAPTESDGGIEQRLRVVASELGHRRPPSAIVADAIRRVIVAGGLPEGERLPTERELALALDTSRSTIRTALHTLAAEGLIRIHRGRSGGSVVQSSAPAGASALPQDDVRRELQESLEFRLALEPAAAALAATRSTRAQKETILELGTRSTPQSIALYQEQDQGLHLSIAEAAGNYAIQSALEEHFRGFFVWANSPFLVPSSYFQFSDFSANHAALVERIAAGDPKRARAEMARHLERAYDEFAAAFSALGRPG